MKEKQRHFSAKEKYEIIREGEYGSMSINEVCRKNRISTALYYQWRKQVLTPVNSPHFIRNKTPQYF